MATMMKEKRKEKKKSKEKSSSRHSVTRELPTIGMEPPLTEELCNDDEPAASTDFQHQILVEPKTPELSPQIDNTSIIETPSISSPKIEKELFLEKSVDNKESVKHVLEKSSSIKSIYESPLTTSSPDYKLNVSKEVPNSNLDESFEVFNKSNVSQEFSNIEESVESYGQLSSRLERMAIPENEIEISQEREFELLSPRAYLETLQMEEEEASLTPKEDVLPSAPCFEEVPQSISYQEVIIESKPKMQCMPIEDVIRLYSGGEMEDVRALSEREEEIVEVGPVSGPEHPLVDLLSTFRSSLMAVERERILLANGFRDEEKNRKSLWKIEKKAAYVSELCPCGANVSVKATYEHATFAKARLPVAKMRLESLLRDVQDSYCHHQHAALLAYYQIEELISETVQSNKPVIREALSLVLGALRQSASALDALTGALERWATALAAALVDHRDLRQLLFLLHHLFKQSRSVRWASRVVQVRVDIESPPRVLALLELLLARPKLDTAQECVEDADDIWEEVDKHGDGSAVSDGTLRERDLLSLLHALPIRDLVARILLFTHNDITQARPQEWGDNTGGRLVLRACYGVRTLIHVLQRATNVHASYARLKQVLRDIAAKALHALACLHLTSCQYYVPELKEKIYTELEASFFEGLALFGSRDLHLLPATLLTDEAAKHYCLTYIEQLHEPGCLSCDERVRIVCQSAADRMFDHELARIALEFLLQTGLRRKWSQCKGSCEQSARDCVSVLIAAHPYFHTVALHILADMNMVEQLDVSCVKVVQAQLWRPSAGDARALLDDWARRCTQLLQPLLMLLDCTPHTGISLDVQLTIGNWVSAHVRALGGAGGGAAGGAIEGWWAVLRRLRTHRGAWLMPMDAPPPDEEPTDLFSIAYALVSSSWGHCLPVICSEGVSALCKLSAQRPRDAVHCLAGIMLVMGDSPESVSLTPKFNEVLSSLLSSGPGLMARALGRAGPSGAEMLTRLVMAQMDNRHTSRASVLSAWLHALWRASLPPSALYIADTLACHTRLWPHLDAYGNALLQEENAKEHITHVVRNASTAPLLCEVLLRVCHTEHDTLVHYGYGRLLNALHQQRVASQKIHVDNALQKVSANLSSDELVIYRCATAALSAPMSHPSHLTLWRLLLHLYLQRAPDFMSSPPVGPLFFSGLIKSRVLSQIKKRLQETITYHHKEAETLKASKSVETSQAQSTKNVTKTSPALVDDLLPALTIVDLTGDSSCSSDSEESETESEIREESPVESSDLKKNVLSLVSYHKAAEKMIGEYLCWLEEGEKVRAMPHHADIARFIPEHALEAAWKRSVCRPPPSEELDSFPLPTPPPPPDNTPPITPFHIAVDHILKIKDRSRKRHRRMEIKSPVEDVDFKHAPSLLSLVDKHLKDIDKLALEWCEEVSRISSLDSQLWELVSQLRVDRPVPAVRRQCANKCEPLTLVIQDREWCLSVDANRGIEENRSSARSRVRRLARARPHAARTAAALHTIARRTRSCEAGVRVVERAWRCAGAPRVVHCAPARTVLTALVEQLCERWICDNGVVCSELLSSWGRAGTSQLQQALCGCVLAPRRLAPAHWPLVYTTLLDSHLPEHALFSHLSKFEMSRWSSQADVSQRKDMLDALLRTVQRYGPSPAPAQHMVVELVGVHTCALLTSQHVPAHVVSCARASLHNKLPYAHWTHVVNAVNDKAADVPFDQLGHLLRELGVMWWEARTGLKGSGNVTHLAGYAPCVASLLRALQRAFVAAATRLSYAPERVGVYAWSGLQESWGAWITPHAGSFPLLPSTVDDERYTTMLRYFVDSVHQIMLDCPGTEIYLLQQIFEWCVQSYANVQSSPCMTPMSSMTSVPSVTQESRVQASAMLVELAKLPWNEHQWFYGKSLQVALQMSSNADRELSSWCCSTWRDTTAETLLRDVGDQLVPRLASILYLFTGTSLPLPLQLISDACRVPWPRLPERAVDEALEQFYRNHHNVAQPYHDLPQFRLIQLACELSPPAAECGAQMTCTSRNKRGAGVSQWVRAATSPALLPHVCAHTTHLLNTLALLETPLTQSEGELEELLCRAVVIMCIEPAASAALPVWVNWVASASPRMILASMTAVTSVTVFEHFATLSDAVTKAALQCKQGSISWSEVFPRWSQCPWRGAAPLCARARLHAAYACVNAHEHAHELILAAVQALLTADINFIENEVIVGVWICYCTRVSRQSASSELTAAASALLSRWAEERRSLLSRMALVAHTDQHQPTPLHRVLCTYALWVQSLDHSVRRTFESAYTSALGGGTDLAVWVTAPQHNKLVSLALRLYPKHQHYFQHELQHA